MTTRSSQRKKLLECDSEPAWRWTHIIVSFENLGPGCFSFAASRGARHARPPPGGVDRNGCGAIFSCIRKRAAAVAPFRVDAWRARRREASREACIAGKERRKTDGRSPSRRKL